VINQYGWTPVNAAADSGHLEVVKFLVETSADITVANNDGWTPVNAEGMKDNPSQWRRP
jgi:ankyrin repeat protein